MLVIFPLTVKNMRRPDWLFHPDTQIPLLRAGYEFLYLCVTDHKSPLAALPTGRGSVIKNFAIW